QKLVTNGYVTSVNHDGLIVAKVRRRGPRFPWKGIAICFIAFFAFKCFLLSQLGAVTYNERCASRKGGTYVEEIGAYVMSIDPMTIWISEQMNSVLR
ncbi:hypothetical protein JI58_08965, partial [Marinosulfonomonas sp. PRT-SC04]